ncbi:GNAT family N-acetyltransferase [Streptomyces himalayensis]|uniref:GNAT family N-acetyltransferase n=1 Tax=Streptomyces himalayensis subsp. himalayensis TaxID=2756131 RepID=A0A7W0DL95_9ACTN|nr:GNAT family N-acetyltransferase [Streptomyces himalayensis]MBA2947131.1 GNAT family N-acetyltransferase [Streptomyces himalayensis subsp. himalayensis]
MAAPSYDIDWQLTSDLDDFMDRAGDFLRADPVLHTVLLTVTENLRVRGRHVYGAGEPLFGTLSVRGEVVGAFLWTPPFPVQLTSVPAEAAAALAERLADRTADVPGVAAEQATADAFGVAWQKRTGAVPRVGLRQRLYRLEKLTPPEPVPPGRARVAGEGDRELLKRWHTEFSEAVGDGPGMDPGEWADSRLAYGGVTLWETPDGTPVSMAGATRRIAGMVRVAPVYTPRALRGRGYAGAATAEVSRAALAAGADEVLLFTDLANPTSNGLYQRIGYRPVQDSLVCLFTAATAAV